MPQTLTILNPSIHTHTHTSLARCVMKTWDPTPSFEYFLSFCSQWKPPSTAWEHCTSSYFLTCWNPCKKFTTSVVRQSLHKTLEGKTSNQTFSMQKCILCASAAHGATATGQSSEAVPRLCCTVLHKLIPKVLFFCCWKRWKKGKMKDIIQEGLGGTAFWEKGELSFNLVLTLTLG